MMFMPSIFRDNFVEDFFDDFNRPVKSNKGLALNNIMKTDVVENENGYEISNILFRGNGLAITNLYRLSDGKAENGSMTLKYDAATGSFTARWMSMSNLVW